MIQLMRKLSANSQIKLQLQYLMVANKNDKGLIMRKLLLTLILLPMLSFAKDT